MQIESHQLPGITFDTAVILAAGKSVGKSNLHLIWIGMYNSCLAELYLARVNIYTSDVSRSHFSTLPHSLKLENMQ